MKVLVNGGINISELDGWWEEAYTPEVGWALGDGLEHGDDPNVDAEEAGALYNLLEQEVVPEFYKRDEKGIPEDWVARMRESMARLTPRFSANRTVRDYTEKYYIPAAKSYKLRATNNTQKAVEIIKWKNELNQKWHALRFINLKIETINEQHNFEVQVYLDELDIKKVKVELFADEVNGFNSVCEEMKYQDQLAGTINIYIYRASVPAERPAEDYTPRIIPYFSGVNVPLESSQILWQK